MSNMNTATPILLKQADRDELRVAAGRFTGLLLAIRKGERCYSVAENASGFHKLVRISKADFAKIETTPEQVD
jgi:protein subunit release factor B